MNREKDVELLGEGVELNEGWETVPPSEVGGEHGLPSTTHFGIKVRSPDGQKWVTQPHQLVPRTGHLPGMRLSMLPLSSTYTRTICCSGRGGCSGRRLAGILCISSDADQGHVYVHRNMNKHVDQTSLRSRRSYPQHCMLPR